MTRKRLLPDDRKLEILNAAIKVAGRPGGWSKLTRDAVAKEAGCAEGLPSKYFGTMVSFRRAIMRAAIVAEELGVIAQGLAAGDKCAQKADPELKARALNTLAG
jgi:AcrR family transcriptional regulator